MAKMIDELWPVFLAEVTEQLDILELELIKIEDVNQVDIDQLFRLFHTIKSSCAMLDFRNMEEVAHTSEDLLDLARKGTIQLNEKMVDALLEAVDALKKQLKESEATQASPGPRPSVVALLKVHTDAVTAATKTNKSSNNEQSFNVVEEEFEQLETLAKASLEKALFAFATNKSSEQKSHLIKLRNFFDLMGVTVIKNLVKDAIVLTETAQGFDVIKNADLIVAILDKLEYLEKISSRNLLVSDTRKIAFNQHGLYLEKLLHTITPEISAALMAGVSDVDGEFPEQLFLKIQQTRSLLHLTGYKNIALLLVYLYQALKLKYYKNDLHQIDSILIDEIINFLKGVNLAVLNKDDIAFIDQLIKKINNSGAGEGNDDVNVTEFLPELENKFINGVLWKKYLKSTDIDKVNAAYNRENFIFEIYADLESNTEFAARFIDWLYENTTVITNIHVDSDVTHKLSINAGLAFLCYCENQEALGAINDRLKEGSGFLQYTQLQKNSEQNVLAENASSSQDGVTSTLRIDSKTLDRFVSQVGEMITRRNMLTYIIHDEAIQTALKSLDGIAAQVSVTSPAEAQAILQATTELSRTYNRLLQADMSVQQVSNRIQEEVMSLRVVPIAMVFNRLPKMVRRLARELNKNISLQMSGESVKIDKGLVDLLMEPMSHIVRNAIDHGVESEDERVSLNKNRAAVIQINAINKGNILRIEINDDGRGLPKGKILAKAFIKGIDISETASDDEIFNLIFLPGFSTSEVITEVSGRGVGMDAVKEKIKSVGGRVMVSSVAGKGTQFVLELPLSVAIQGVVVVESSSQKYAIPERSVIEIMDVQLSDIQSVNNQSTYMFRGNLLPLYDLDKLLYFDCDAPQSCTFISVIVVSNGVNQIGIVVKRIDGRHEIYVKDVNHQLLNLPGFGGASILGDGSVIIILDADKLIKLAEQNPQPASLFLKTG
jgi:two-component system chemotaxis sensor kinase CheA